MNLQTEPPEKTKNSSSPPSFSSLPNEIIVTCLARLSRSYYPTLSTVSKTFKSLISSTELYADWSQLGITEQCLYVCIADLNNQYPQWFRLWTNPNQTLTNSKKKTIPNLLVPVLPSNLPVLSGSTLAVGSEIYVVGGPIFGKPSSAMRVLDCRSNTWRDAPGINVARTFSSTIEYDGRIYVMGGCKGLAGYQPWAEVFDTKTHTWKLFPDPGIEVRMCGIDNIVETDGKIKCRIGYKMHGYDTKQGKWECCGNESDKIFPRSHCVIKNVSYRCSHNGQAIFEWYDVKDENWKGVKGLDSLRNKYQKAWRNKGGSCRFVCCGGKLVLFGMEDIKVIITRTSYGVLKSWWIIVVEVKFGEMWSGMVLCIQSPQVVISCIV